MRIVNLWSGLAVLTLCCTVSAVAEDEYVAAKLLEKTPLEYPGSAKARRLEGWAYYSYVVGIDGKVDKVTIHDSSGIDVLDQELVRSLRSRVYEPATLNGLPVEEYHGVLPFTFKLIGAPRGAQRGFTRKYKQALTDIAEGDLDEARIKISDLEAVKQRGLYEELYLQVLLAEFNKATGDTDRERVHLSRVMDFYDDGADKGEQLVPPEFFLKYLARSYQLEVQRMMLGEAFGSADWMKNIDPDSELTRKVTAHAESLAAQIEGREFWMKGELLQPVYGGDVGMWQARLIRKEIELKSVVGRLDKILLVCERGRRRLPNDAAEIGWIIPDSWGTCDLGIWGEIGASLVVAELPAGSLAPGLAQ
ncbi:MAG: energy transducer TonB [Halieaceae bacterium]|nr:energy transducer TonB [Halieaceae bacterium]MCP5204859.1 energy transducer TonB [Pseudomonadales bacterium]